MALNGLICFFIRTMFPLINWSQLCIIVFLSVWPLQLFACSWGQTSEVCNVCRPVYEYLLHYMLSTFSVRHCCSLLYSLLHSTYACGLLYCKRNHLHVVRIKLRVNIFNTHRCCCLVRLYFCFLFGNALLCPQHPGTVRVVFLFSSMNS